MEAVKVLVVDDNVKNIQLAANAIKQNTDYLVIYATSAKEAFKLLQSHEISLILLDIMMPEMDGYQAAKILAQNPQTAHIPIIFLTANADDFSIGKGFDLGAKDYVTKPFNIKELISRVKTHANLYIAQKSLLAANDELETIFETTKDGIALLDLETNFLSCNSAYLKMTGFTKEELLTKSCIALSVPEDIPRSIKVLATVMEKGFVENYEKNCIVKDDKRIQVNMSISLMPDKQRILLAVKDITHAKEVEKKMTDYITLIDKHIITSSTDLYGTITAVSQAFCEISGYTKSALVGNSHNIVRCSETVDLYYKELWDTISKDVVFSREIKNRKKDGSNYWIQNIIAPLYDANAQKIGYISVAYDITDKKRIEELSITDKLTGLYNRLKLDELLEYEINQSKRYKTPMSVMIVDIDFFKSVNDTYGHQIGDKILQELASLMQKNRRSTDSIGRWGGEEFLIILSKTNYEMAMEVAQKMRIAVENFEFSVVKKKTISVGVSEFYENDTEQTLLERADKALYKAKNSGRNRVNGEGL